MAGRIFINYRRDDVKAEAARLHDRLAAVFGASNVFMDVDNLLPGERFDRKLKAALAETDVFLAVIGPRWMELLNARAASGERDYVCEEIAGALAKEIAVIPVLVDRAPLPLAADLPEDIRDLVLHQKHDIVHESFGRDAAALIEAINGGGRIRGEPVAVPWKAIAAATFVAAGALLIAQPWAKRTPMVSEPKIVEQVKPAQPKPALQPREEMDARRDAEFAERETELKRREKELRQQNAALEAQRKANLSYENESKDRAATLEGYVSGPSHWMHNGSSVIMIQNGASRRFLYESPRQGMRDEGVTSGTLLFDGFARGNAYEGTAYIFSGRCGAGFPYRVDGEMSADGLRVRLTGKAPSRISADCQVTGYRDDTLIFERTN